MAATILSTIASTFYVLYDHEDEAFKIVKGRTINGEFTPEETETVDLGTAQQMVAKFGNAIGAAWLAGGSIDESECDGMDLEDLVARLGTADERITELQQEVERLATESRRCSERLSARDAEITRLKAELARSSASRGADAGASSAGAKVKTIKREFAKLYHPNNSSTTGIEKLIRTEIFKEFWEVLERVERA